MKANNVLLCQCGCLTAFVALVFLGTLTGFIWTRTTSQHWTNSGISNNNNVASSSKMTAEYYKFLRGQILSESGFDRSLSIALDDPRSYEWQALQWLFAHDDPEEVATVEAVPVLQRFAIVTAFLSLDIDIATDHECDWETVQRNDQRQIISMDFSPRSLTGGTIPSVMTYLSSLEVLDVTDQGLQGRLPSPHGWTNLRELKLGGNKLTSFFNIALPPNTTWPIHIEMIDLRGNDLVETIGTSSSSPVASWTKLRHLDLHGNTRLASSTLLSDLHWSTIEYLDIADTNISGSLPTNADYTPLQTLVAGHAPLTGSLPDRLADASSLRILQLGQTTASRLTGTLELSITSNDDITGTLPSSWGGLSKLEALDLYENPKLQGSIPDSWRAMTSLKIVRLVDTGLTGTIPSSLSQWTNLQSLSLHRTALNGSVPAAICALRNLTAVTADCGGAVPDVVCTCCNFCFRRENN
jgi:hypothetical protein